MRLLLILLAFSGSTLLMSQQEFKTADWKPYPAGHWPQEPDGFYGMKFDASRAETAKTIKLEGCQTVKFGNVSCNTAVVFEGRSFKASVMFLVPQGYPPETGKLGSVYAEFGKDDFPFVKAAIIKMFGPPHQSGNPAAKEEPAAECLSWQGNKAEIRLNVLREKGMFVIEPNFLSRGWKVKTEATIEFKPVQ
jgi:hypothetical protein